MLLLNALRLVSLSLSLSLHSPCHHYPLPIHLLFMHGAYTNIYTYHVNKGCLESLSLNDDELASINITIFRNILVFLMMHFSFAKGSQSTRASLLLCNAIAHLKKVLNITI